jgi:hypothetical protein
VDYTVSVAYGSTLRYIFDVTASNCLLWWHSLLLVIAVQNHRCDRCNVATDVMQYALTCCFCDHAQPTAAAALSSSGRSSSSSASSISITSNGTAGEELWLVSKGAPEAIKVSICTYCKYACYCMQCVACTVRYIPYHACSATAYISMHAVLQQRSLWRPLLEKQLGIQLLCLNSIKTLY